jgi:acyl carrier protein
VLSDKFKVDSASVTDETKLQEDLDLDSIDLFDMIGEIEKQRGISVDINDFIQARTFGDLVTTLEGVFATSSAAQG